VKKEDGVEFGVLCWGGGMEDVLRPFIFSENCGVAWRALDDNLRRIDERAATGGDMKLQEKMTLKLRTEGAAGRSPSCAVAPIIMEMDDDQRNSKKRDLELAWNQMFITSLGTNPRIRCLRGVPSASQGSLCLRLFGLSCLGLPQVLFCRRLCLVEMSLLLRDMR